MEDQPTRTMLTVSQSTIHGYPYPSISSVGALEFTLNKIIRTDTSRFKLFILHVQEDDDYEDRHEKSLRLLAYFEKKCREAGVTCESWIKGGHPAKVIIHEVHRLRPDLLVLGSRNLGWFRRLFVRSISETCARRSECPVLVIKRQYQDTPEDPVDD